MQLQFHLPVQTSDEAKRGWLSEFGLADRLMVVIRDHLEAAKRDLLTDASVKFPTKEAVLAAAGVAFKKYVTDIDLSFVPNLIEPLVDKVLMSLFLGAVDRLYDALSAGS